ncbi:recombination protein RecF [Pseudoalteromonas sp. S327]|nr:recombination protein RecF [Pseudoalteromonas sp. S327]TMO15501.1 recombination protein RecF [Pseudoalteromonas sp. S326]
MVASVINKLHCATKMSYHLNNFLRKQVSSDDPSYLFLLYLVKSRKDKRLTKSVFAELGELGRLKRRVVKYANHFRSLVDPNAEITRDSSSMVLSALKSIQVKNFRGFSSLNENDEGTFIPFTKGVNVFFAPNGGGKTSLCEAIEYSLTNDVKEANRRNTPIKNYIKNGGVHKIKCILACGAEAPVSPYWNSCFIDRNRLHEFSLLGSKDTNVKQSDVLATLFELEEIDEIINAMVKPASFKANDFIKKSGDVSYREAVQKLRDKKCIRRDEIDNIEKKKSELAELFELKTFDDVNIEARKSYYTKLKAHLVASTQRFEVASDELDIYGLTKYLNALKRLNDKLEEKKATLRADSSKLNYRKLYKAIQNFDDISTLEQCPACETPISDVCKHPRDVVKDELPKLEHLNKLTIACEKIEERIKFRVDISSSYINKYLNEHRDSLSQEIVSVLNAILNSDKTDVLEYSTCLSALVPYEKELEQLNDFLKAKNERVAKQSSRLTSLNSKIDEIEEKIRACVALETDINARKRKLSELNDDVIRILADINRSNIQRKNDNEFNNFAKALEESYKKLYEELTLYKQEVELENISGIEQSTLQYYNQINKHDAPSDVVSEIKFKQTNGTYRIILKMQDEEGDAFCVLSEGHLRALGLALLLAVAKKNRHPIIIFDDVVNAIDTEHRSNIIDMFSEDSYLRNIQRIITTHDRMFWEKLSNKNKKATDADTFSSNVLKSTNKGIVIQNYGVSYSHKIKEALDVYDVRQALVYSRIWFETMVNEYCVNNSIQITSQFTSRQLKKDNWLEISLEATYKEVGESLGDSTATFDFLKNDLLNWSGQNQEHHAFDEYNYNFSHATTSLEVQNIYEKLWVFEAQLNPTFTVEKLNYEKAQRESVKQKLTNQLSNPNFIGKAPVKVVQAHRDKLAEVNADISLLERILEQV